MLSSAHTVAEHHLGAVARRIAVPCRLFPLIIGALVCATCMLTGPRVTASTLDDVYSAIPITADSTARTDSVATVHLRDLTDSVRNSKNAGRSGSGLDTVVRYSASDSVIFYAKKKMMRLRGSALSAYRTQKLEAEIIEIYFDSGLMSSSAARDSTGKIRGYPKFSDAGKDYVGETIKYNFKTKSGAVALGETTIDNAHFFGSRIRRNPDESMFVENGCYTTCDHPHPHFYFSSPKMKVIPGDRILLNDLYLYVQDIPVLYLPFGVFFPNKGGRQSGLLIPRPFVDANRGVAFQNLGYYFALSDYYDTQITTDLYSKGGYQLNNKWNYNLRYILEGHVDLSYAHVRPNPLTEYRQEYKFGWTHNQTISPQTRLNANVNFQSNDFNQNTLTTLAQRIQQNVFSSAGLTHSFDNGISTGLNYTRNQDLQMKTWEQTPSLSLTVPALFPFKSLGTGSWLSDISFNYNTVVGSSFRHALAFAYRDTVVFDTALGANRTVRRTDTSFADTYSAAWRHNPSISISPKLGVISLTPSVNFSASVYPRRIAQLTYDTITHTPIDVMENGMFLEYNASAGVSARTTLYGTPLQVGSIAVRHTMMPSIGLSYAPDFSAESYKFYSNYIIPPDSTHKVAQVIRYSRFLNDGGGFASQAKSLSLNWALDNSFDAKVFSDSSDRKIELARLNVSGNYNIMKDSNGLSDIRWSIRTPSIGTLNFNTDFSTTAYSDVAVLDTNGKATGRYTQISRYLVQDNKFPLRVTNFSFYLSAQFGSTSSSSSSYMSRDSTVKDTSSIEIGERFRRRMEYNEIETDVFGDASPGYTPLRFPWSASFTLSYNYSKQFSGVAATQALNIQSSMNFSFTQTWSVTSGVSYDVLNGTLNAPSVTLRKIIHCWALDVTWYPMGSVRGFYLSFSPTAAILKDLKLEKRTNTYIQ